jgi:hypothetical protein
VRTRSRCRTAPLLLLALLSPAGAWAQFDQYTAPGRSTERPGDRKELLDKEMQEARWHLGKVRVDPWANLSDIEYFDDSFGGSGGEGSADLTVTVGAGLRAYLPAGPNTILAARVLPEYVWWKEVASRRRLNGRYGVGAFGFFNHLAVEAVASRDQQRGFASPEFPQPVSTRTDRLALSGQLALSGHISAFASADRLGLRNLLDPEEEEDPRIPAFNQLDRDETLLRGGLTYDLPGGWSVGLGVERSEVEFDAEPGVLDRSNSGNAPLFLLGHDSRNIHLSLELARRSLTPTAGSSFVPYEATSARLLAGFRTTRRLSYTLYGGRGIVYSLLPGYSYFQDDRLGVSTQLSLGWRTRLRLYGEAGRDDYTAEGPGFPDRRDDVRSFGATVGFEVSQRAQLTLRFAHSEYDSDVPGAGRSLATFGAGLALGGQRDPW